MADTPRVTVPVEDLAGKLKSIRDKFLMPTPDKDFTDYAIMTRCVEALSAAPAPEGGAVKGPGDYTMVLTEPQAFEKFPALASHIERMAVGRSVGSLIEWDAFLRELNAALATREVAPAEAGEREGLAAELDRLADCEGGMRGGSERAAETMRQAAKHLRAQPQARYLADEVDDVKKTLEADGQVIEYFEAQRRMSALKALRGTDTDKRAVTYIDAAISALRAQPQAREDAQPVGWTGSGSIDALKAGLRGHMWPTKAAPHPVALYTHPAPDALRVAVEALTVARSQAERGADKAGCNGWRSQEMCRQVVPLIDQALAALQAEQESK